MTTYDGESPAESSRAPWTSSPAVRVPVQAQDYAPRVNQVDSDELDDALVGMLSEKLGSSISNFRSSFSFDLKPELELVIKLVIFRFGIWNAGPKASPGAKLQNLKLVSDRSQGSQPTRRILLLYLLLHPPIFPKYLMARIRQHALSQQWPDLPRHDWRKKVWIALNRLENAARVWELAGWGCFLWDGRYPSLLMRLLGLRLVPSKAHLARLVSYEFMNRQLVWSAFTEFLMFSVPLIPPLPPVLTPTSLIAPIKAFLSQPTAIDYGSIPLLPQTNGHAGANSKTPVHNGPLAHLPRSTCPICYLRQSSAPVPLDSSTSQGAALNLPPIQGSSQGDFSHEEEHDEFRIYVPAQTDCEGGCRWCYYCVGEELYKHREVISKRADKKGDKGEKHDKSDQWRCLRCGGGVTKAWRVGSEDG